MSTGIGRNGECGFAAILWWIARVVIELGGQSICALRFIETANMHGVFVFVVHSRDDIQIADLPPIASLRYDDQSSAAPETA